MKTTLNIDDRLIQQAEHLTGIHEKTQLVRLGLEALISREAAKRLVKLAGSTPQLKAPPRRRST